MPLSPQSKHKPTATQRDESAASAAATRVESWCEGLIEASWLAALAVAPLFVNIYSQTSFDPDKAAAVKSLVLIMIGAWSVKVAAGGRAFRPVAAPLGSEPAAAGDWRRSVLAPALMLTLCLLVSSLFSLDPDLSWRGSYARGQGTWTRLAYLAIFAAMLAHLRRPAQLRRLIFVVMLTGLSVALYAVLQHLGLDPVHWAVRHDRVGSTLGNPIFFSGFLLMTWFLALVALAERFGPSVRRSRLPAMLRAGVVLYVALLELVAVVLSQSRGPFLGLLAGSGVFALGVLARQPRRVRRRLIGAAALLLAVLIWLATATPFAGRLASLTDPTSGTARVRLAIWGGTARLLTSEPPAPDRLGELRPWIGHGPETFALTFPRFHPPELSRLETPGSAPDRAHNVIFDLLVTLGGLGLLAWLWLAGGLCHLAVARLSPAGRGPPGLVLGIGAACGAALPWLLGEVAWIGVGLGVGSVLGLLILLAVAGLRGAPRGGTDTATRLLILALLATLAGHFVELQFSFAVTATELYFWALAALLVVISQGWLRQDPVATPADRLPGGALAGCRAGLVAAPVLGCLSFLLIAGLYPAVGADLLFAEPAGAGGAGVIWLLLLAGLGAAAMAPELRRVGWAAFAGASLGAAAILAAVHASRLLALPSTSTAGWDLVRLSDAVSRHVSIFIAWLLAIVLVAGLALGMRTGDRRPWARRPGLAVVAVAAVMLVVPWWVNRSQIAPLRAGAMLKHSATLLDAGHGQRARLLLSEASRLNPGEPLVYLMAGRAALQAARASDLQEERESYLARAAADLERARQIAPLDPDHTVNLARFLAARGELTSDAARRSRFERRATEEYRRALRLKPSSATLLAESAVFAARHGERDLARELLERALEVDPDLAVRLPKRNANP